MKHFVRGTLVALTLLSVPTFASPSQQPVAVAQETLTVRAGNSKTLKAVGVTRVAIGDPGVADIHVGEDDVLRIDGKKVGETVLLVWTGKVRREYRIVVEK